MKKHVKNLIRSLYLWFQKIYGRYLIKCQAMHASAIFFEAYIKTFQLFPENKLSTNIDLALSVRSMICDSPSVTAVTNVSEEHIQKLYESVCNEPSVKNIASKYYLLGSLYYSYGIYSDFLKELSIQQFESAKIYDEKANKITTNDVNALSKKIKLYLKNLKAEVAKLNNQRIVSEKLKIVRPFKITSSHVVFVLSVFSTIFVVSGFIYNKIFLAFSMFL